MEELLLKLKAHKGSIKVESDNLKISLPKDFSDPGFIDELKKNKESLINYINEQRNASTVSATIPIAIAKESYRLTPPQLRLFLFDQLNNDSLAYNQSVLFQIDGPLGYDQLANAFEKIIWRHESLRTSFFIDEKKQPMQKVLEEFSFNIQHFEGKVSEFDTIIDGFIRPFDLGQAPLLRVGLIKESADKHVLLFDIHHIIFDGLSLEVLIDELVQLYEGEDLPELKLQYKDFSEWYHNEENQASVLAQKQFWKREFDDIPSPLELPLDFQRPKESKFRGGSIAFKINKKETAQLQQICSKNNTTLFSVLLSIYSIMLSKLSNNQNIVVGTPMAGRNHTDLQGLIGMFVNTLALPIHLPQGLSFKNYLKQLHSKVITFFDNADYPYEKLVNDLGVERDTGRNALFDVLLALHTIQKEFIYSGSIKISEYERESFTSKFDLVLDVFEDTSGLAFNFGYSTELFTASTIKRFISFFKGVTKQVLENEDIAISEISLLSKKEEQDLIKSTRVDYPTEATLVSLFEDMVAIAPDKEAVIFEDDCFTYGELNNLSNAIAEVLRDKGVGRDDIVGLLMDKNLYTVACQLGILKAGGCYLPIDPSYPRERIDYIINDSNIDLLITNESFKDLPGVENSIDKIVLEDVLVKLRGQSIPNPTPVNDPKDLCYIIYTSGTTGNPKGVMVEHRNVVRLLINDAFQFDFGKDDVWTMFHSHCFDFSVWEMYGALLYGGKLIIVSQSDARDPFNYLSLLRKHNVTVLNQTPTAFDSLKNACKEKNVTLPGLRYVIFGGEALVPLKLKDWNASHPEVKLVNMYGITEITVHASYKEIRREDIEQNVSNIGAAIPTNTLYLLDSNKNLQPQGVIGEIYVGGDGVARGYLNKDELTTSRFIENPYHKGERLYRSGDLGRLLKNGEIEYLGRVDNQVQLKGFRIELKEIEHHLLLNAQIEESVVVLRNADQNEPYLCAYYVSKNNVDLTDLRAYLAKYLPKYMIPSYFVRLDEIPFTANNKIATSRLPVPDLGSLKDNYVPPATDKERLLCEIWEKELGLKQVGVRDNYFSLGGDSLKAIGLISSINEALKTSYKIADLYSFQTIEELVNVQNFNEDEGVMAMEEAKEELRLYQEKYKRENSFPDSYEEVYPMNGVEKGMVFYSLQTKSDNIHEILYHEQNLYDFPVRDFDFEKFKTTIQLLCEKHSELRKIFDLDNLAHIIVKEIEPEVHFIDIAHLDKKEWEQFIAEKMQEGKLRGIELSFSVIWRMNVIKVRDDYQYLLFDFNHALFDGWSLSSFMTELQNTYLILSKNEDYILKKLSSSYGDQILGELAAAKKESSKKYWKEELEGYTRFELPQTGLDHEYIRDEFKFGKSYRKELEQVAEKYNSSFKHLCFAAYVYMLRMLSYGNDITTGIATNIRPLLYDAEQLLGCFLNTIPFRAIIPDGLTWSGYINFIEKKLRELKYHEQVPFHKILEIVEEERNDKNPIFDVFFNYIDFRIFQELSAFDSTIEEEETDLQRYYLNDHGLITTHIFAHDNDFNLVLTYSTSFITQDQVKSLAGYFKNILDQFIYHADSLIDKQALIGSIGDSLKLGNAGNHVNYPNDVTLVDLFESQVAKTPGKEAVVFEGSSLTYAELNNLSNAIAEALRAKGVGQDSIVGLLIDKNLYTVACQLGVLKAGGCYLPIDPRYPTERINYMMDDSGLSILVTDKAYENLLTTSILKVVLENVMGSLEKDIPNPTRISSPENLCYIIYTSGTTGNPKGVMVEHRNVVRLLFNDEFQFDFGEDDVWTMFHSHCFDFSVWEMYGALLYGGKLIIVSQSDARDPFNYLSLLRKHNVTVLNQTPTAFDSLKNACKEKNVTLPSLRYVIFGGEALVPLKLKDWYVSHPEVKLVNMYGITEITVHASYKEIRREDIEQNVSNIGAAIPTNTLYLLDSNKNLQPQGVIGEIYVGGDGVARGYLNKDELTATRFIENPYREGERLYRSGDLGRSLKNGEIEYLGRIDNQVQLKGFRIELKEIEHHLLLHAQIEESLVVLRNADQNQPYLCAYYVSKDNVDLTDLRAYLVKYLPKYMIPSYFVRLEEIPVTSNNKIATSRLPDPDVAILDTYVAPASEKERLLCTIWEKELGLKRIGIRDNYFSLGGDSLKAIGLVSAMNRKLKASYTIADLYSFQTIEELVEVENLNKAEGIKAVTAAREELRSFQERYKEQNDFPNSYEATYPMNGVEMGMVFHSLQTKSDNVHEVLYHEQNLYDFPEKNFDFEKFKRTVHLLCEKHGELRKIFDLDNLAHIIVKEIDPEINFIDISHLSKKEREQFITEKMHQEKLRGTELSFSVIWRMNIIKVRDDYQYLLFDFNHALFDGWSLSSFMTELQKTYLSLHEDESYAPKKLLSSYEDQIVGELAAAKNELSIHYWKEELEDYTRFELPSTGMPHEYVREEFKFDKSYRRELEQVAEKHNTSFKHLCFAAYIYLQRVLSYSNDITAGITTNIRPLVHDAEQLLGCFLNTIPFRVIIPQALTWSRYINLIENKLRELKYHEHVPFYKILEIVNEESNERNPIFDVSFNYVDFRVYKELSAFDKTIAEEKTSVQKAYMNDYALLGIHVHAFDDDFGLELDYSTSFITREQAKTLPIFFKNILDQFIYNAESQIEKEIILNKDESIKRIAANNSTKVNYPITKTVLDLFSEQVQLVPDAPAIVFGDENLSYRDLNLLSNNWATNLINLGIGVGSVVGLRMTRSIDTITAILAIMKTGAAYMVLDPDLPSSRMVHMIEESGCVKVITNLDCSSSGLKSYDWMTIKELDQEPNSQVIIPKTSPENLAYILYTSGSTGKPKGCMISHDNLYNYTSWCNDYYFQNAETGNWGLMTPLYFDLSTTAIFTSITRGKKLFLFDEGESIDQLLKKCFSNPAIDTLKLTPTHITILKDLNVQNRNTKTIICGGEALKNTHLETLNAIGEDIKIYNEYGPTETTVGCTVTEIDAVQDKITIGGPIANTKIHILDIDREMVPIGVVGEIYVSGAGVAEGYIGNEKLTRERFIEVNDLLCYKTGDFGRWNEVGDIEYIGRKDNQLKIRGFRVELGEIEAVLESLPHITQAFVSDYGEGENKQLCAYLIGEEELVTSQLDEVLASVLPEYMLPAEYIKLDQFPLTRNGKIDSKALPSPNYDSGENYVAPNTLAEREMAGIWSEILDVDQAIIGVNDSFFKLGGNSLSTIKLKNRISKELAVSIDLRDLFKYPTIKLLLNHISSLEETQHVSIHRAPKQDYYPLSSAQKRMYFLYEFDKESTSYNIPGFYRIGGEINVGRLEAIFDDVVARHESLRTVFELKDGVPVQRVLEGVSFKMGHHFGEPTAVKDYLLDFIRPFNLSEELPIRATLMEVSGEQPLLLIDMHHIINDGVSQEILIKEFWSLYNGHELPELTIQYKDYSVWQRGEAYQKIVSKHKRYWLDRYDESITYLELPFDHARPSQLSDHGDTYSVNLEKSKSDQLRSLAQKEGVTMFTLFFTIYNILLSKISNQRDIIVGTPIAGRHHSDLENMVGMFVNTLALRNDVDANLTFRELLDAIHDTTLSGFEHQLYQYEELVDALELPRNVGRNPLFDVFFAYDQQMKEVDLGDSAIEISHYDMPYKIAKFDLSLSVLDVEEIELSFSYRTDLFGTSTISRFSFYLNRIIEEVLENKDRLISSINVLSKPERNRLLVDFNDTFKEYDLGKTVIDLFREKVDTSPDSTALVFGEESLTYSELDRRSEIWAMYLADVGVTKGSMVGLIMTRSMEMITAIIAVMKAGAAYVPINPDQPLSRTHHMLNECESNLLITNIKAMADDLSKQYDCLTPDIFDNEEVIGRKEKLPDIALDSLAYVIYTSGSTGKPKGVMVHHESLVNLIFHEYELFEMSGDERILQFSPYYFDASVEQIWICLTTGASLILIEEEMLVQLDEFAGFLKEKAVTHLDGTPSFIEKVSLEGLTALRRVVVGGETCKPALAKKVSKKCPLYNEYGPTETTVTSTVHKIENTDDFGERVPIGRPIANTQAYVLDGHMNLLPEGVVGELYLGGKGLASGYLKRPELSKERFVENPFGEGLIYKTGDLAQWRSDGILMYWGRNDDQVKLRGYRIELGEIESELESIDEVNQAVVVAHGSDDSQKLVAYLCGNEEFERNELNSLLSSKLPDYMIPAVFIWMDNFPLNANDKIDKRALPDPDLTEGEAYVPPTNSLQKKLVLIWSEILNLEADKVSITSDFFNLGGHSLTAITLTNKINKLFSVNLSLKDLFIYRTIKDQSEHIQNLGETSTISIAKAPKRNYYPLSSAQKRMYFLYEFDKASTAYNTPVAYKIHGDLDIIRLESSIMTVIERHESLRTVFKSIDNEVVQQIIDWEDFKIGFETSSEADLAQDFKEFIQPFDLEVDFPTRVCLLTLGEQEHVLLMDFHHIISDLKSNSILMNDIISYYMGHEVSGLSLQYKDYAVWQNSESQLKIHQKDKAFWISEFKDDVSILNLPIDHGRPLVKTNRGGTMDFTIGEEMTQGLRAISDEIGATLFMTLMGVFNVLLSKLSNNRDIVIGTPIAGRHHADLENIVGMFLNTLAIRNNVDSNKTIKEFLIDVKNKVLKCMDSQLYPYEELIDDLGLARNANRNPLFDVMFVYQKSDNEVFKASDLTLESLESDGFTSKFDLLMNCTESDDKLLCRFEYYLEIFEPETIQSFINYFKHMVYQVINNPDVKVEKLNLINNEQQFELIKLFNETDKSYESEKTIPQLFEEQVQKTPEAVALDFMGMELTYQVLNEKSNQLARVLRKEGITSNSVVGVMQGRSLDMVISLLAILKSGGAYLPIDLNYPEVRVRKMVEDSGMQLLLTDLSPSFTLDEKVKLLNVKKYDYEREEKSDLTTVNSHKDLLYVIYTSGSTGTPKGLMLNHRNLTNLMDFHIHSTNINTSSVLQFTTLNFDPSFVEIFSALLTGGKLYLIEEEMAMNFSRILSHIQSNGIKTIYMPSSVLNQMFNSSFYQDQLPTCIENIITAGEQLIVGEHFKEYLQKNGVYLHNYYGPAETQVVTANTIDPSKAIPSMPHIGKPIQNTQIYVLNEDMQQQPVNVTGELYVGGMQVGDGYLSNPGLTAERFINNPFHQGEILYKTGDLAKWLSDGNIEFLGRTDTQMKLNGVRIEPGDIECHLNAMDMIADSAVVVTEVQGHKSLVAYYVSDRSIEESEIRTYLIEQLPLSMIPAYYIHLQEMPLTATGKLARKSLPKPEERTNQYVAPINDLEEELVAIWSEIMGIERNQISTNRSFFELGGNSLKAVTLVNKISKVLSVDISLKEFFVKQTIRNLSEYIITIKQIKGVNQHHKTDKRILI